MKKILALVLALVMVLGLAACSSSTAKSDTAAADTDTLKIGVVCPISGVSAIAGKYITHGIQVVEKELGGKIDINGKEYNIEFIYMDNEASEEKTTNVFQKLINEENVIAIVGPDMSKCALAAGPIAQNAGCPVVATFATNTAVTEVGNYIFRACFIDPFQGKMAATYCWDRGYKTAAVMYNNADAYATGLYEAFVESYTEYGGEVIATEEYSGSDVKDYNVQLTKLASAGADVLFLPNLLSELGLQIQQARTAGITGPILCGDSADTPEVAEVAGPDVEDVGFVSAYSAESTDAASVEFVTKYSELHNGETPNSNAELAYEATQMVLYALKNAKELTRDGVRDALESLSGLELPSGKMTMDPETRNPVKGGVVMVYDAEGTAHFVSSVNPE